MNFEIFGNSHAAILSGAPPSGNIVPKQRHGTTKCFTKINPKYPFRSWFLGPILAYNFYENHLNKVYNCIKDYQSCFSKDYFLFLIVGEIDCRVHLPKYISSNRTYENVVEECVVRYHRSIIDLKKNGKNVGVLGALPSMSDESIKKLMPLKEQSYNVSGTSEIRNKISNYWDKFHKEICKNDDIPFISIYDDLVNQDGTTKEEFFTDFIHISYDKTIDFWIKEFKKSGLL